MDIEYLRKNNLIILECISGSRAYGLETPESDTDIIYKKHCLDYW